MVGTRYINEMLIGCQWSKYVYTEIQTIDFTWGSFLGFFPLMTRCMSRTGNHSFGRWTGLEVQQQVQLAEPLPLRRAEQVPKMFSFFWKCLSTYNLFWKLMMYPRFLKYLYTQSSLKFPSKTGITLKTMVLLFARWITLRNLHVNVLRINCMRPVTLAKPARIAQRAQRPLLG